MIATALANKAEMPLWSGDAGAAIGLAQAAQRDRKAAAGQRAHAAMLEARGHAMTGDRAAAERKLDESLVLAARPDDRRRPWLDWMTPASFQHEAGFVCAHLAGYPRWHARAVTFLEPGTETPGIWVPAQNFTWLAFAHARAGEVDQACAAGAKAASAVRAAGSARHAAMLANVCANLHARYPDDARVSELAEALR